MNPKIRLMTVQDVNFATSLTDHEQWGYLPADFGRLMAIEPAGCFIAEVDGEPVGMVTTSSYTDYAFIGSMIVHPDNRGMGFGEALLRHALEYLESKSIRCIELDGTFPAVPLYRRLGFRDKYLSLRFIRPPAPYSGPSVKVSSGGDTASISNSVIQLDRELTGLDRSRLLKQLVADFSKSIYLHHSEAASAYARAYPRAGNFTSVGPIVARDDAAAEYIWNIILNSHHGGPLTIGIPEIRRAAVRMARARGFLYRPPSLRMFRGDRLDYESSIYAIISAEKG